MGASSLPQTGSSSSIGISYLGIGSWLTELVGVGVSVTFGVLGMVGCGVALTETVDKISSREIDVSVGGVLGLGVLVGGGVLVGSGGKRVAQASDIIAKIIKIANSLFFLIDMSSSRNNLIVPDSGFAIK